MVTVTEELEKTQDALAALKNFDFAGAIRAAFGKCPTCAQPVEHGHWLKWCKKCRYVAPISRTQRLEADRIISEETEKAMKALEAV